MNAKAHTAEKLSNVLRDGAIESIKTCSRCGRVYVFHVEKSGCPGCEDGNLYPLTRYLPKDATKTDTDTEAEA
jgi:ribosomal protein L37E